MEEFRDRPELANLETDRVRLRNRSRNLFFGKILREKNKTLKQLKINSGVHLVVQFLEEAENLKNTEILLLVRKRDVANMDYHAFIEFKYDYGKNLPTLTHLCEQLSAPLEILSENMSVAKYIPHAYDWKYWDPNEDIEVKKKGKANNKGKKKGKNKEDTKEEVKVEQEEHVEITPKVSPLSFQKMNTFDLRLVPFLLSEGDILGVRDNSEVGADKDNFQTLNDIQNREKLEELKKLDKEAKKDLGKKDIASNDPFKIFTDF